MWSRDARRLVNLLSGLDQKFAVAESCTCGWFAHMLGSISGCSRIFWGGVVSYSDSSKISVLNVEEDILGHFGAVSAATAKAMARGVRLLSSSDWALAITGIAGPGGGTREKPVGTVHMAICSAQGLVKSQEFHFRGNRRRVRRSAACMALKFLIDNISLG